MDEMLNVQNGSQIAIYLRGYWIPRSITILGRFFMDLDRIFCRSGYRLRKKLKKSDPDKRTRIRNSTG